MAMNRNFELFLDAQVAKSMHTIEASAFRACEALGQTPDSRALLKAELLSIRLMRATQARKQFIAEPSLKLAEQMVFKVDGQWLDTYELERYLATHYIHDAQCLDLNVRMREQVGRVALQYQFDEVELKALELLTGHTKSSWQRAGEIATKQLASLGLNTKQVSLPARVRQAMFAMSANLVNTGPNSISRA
jgi:hypothetical protein